MATDASAPSRAAAAEGEDDAVVGIGDFFVSRDYVPVEYRFGDVAVTLDCLKAAATDFDLTGQIVWQVARVTSWYIAHIRNELAGKDMIELGSGAGLVGMLATHLHTSSVVLSDNEPEVLTLLQQNVEKGYCATACRVHVAALSWGSESDHAALAAATGRSQYPIVLGADVVYWSESVVPLLDSVKRLLQRDGVFILGYFDRAGRTRRLLLDTAAAVGLVYTTVDPASFLPSPMPEEFVDHIHNMTLFRFTWAAQGPTGDGELQAA